MTTEIEKVESELKDALDRYKVWCDAIKNKQLLQRNTKEEIEEINKDIKRDVIMPIVTKLTLLKLAEKNK
jgi:uncharacterized protein YecA (UPF0149 family)